MGVDLVIFVVSMYALTKGADFIIDESQKIALHFNISGFVIGATLVAFGTSLPEMASSMMAAYSGKNEMAVANVVGSNIINIALVLGIVFVMAKKIVTDRDIFAKDGAWGIFPVMVFIIMVIDGSISRFEGFLLLVMMVAYLIFLINNDGELTDEIDIDEDEVKKSFDYKSSAILLLVGFVLVIVGANFAVDSASNIAKSLGVSDWVIGLLLVAFGTSLPELMVSISAAKKGQGDMVLGGIIGSNVSNFTAVLGSSALINPLSIDLAKNSFDISSLLIVTIMLVFITANKLYTRSAGIVLLIVMALVIEHSLSL